MKADQLFSLSISLLSLFLLFHFRVNSIGSNENRFSPDWSNFSGWSSWWDTSCTNNC